MGWRQWLGIGEPSKEDRNERRKHEAEVREMQQRLKTLQAQVEVMRRAQG